MNLWNYITQEEYQNWLKIADKVGAEYCEFGSYCGPHTFANDIEKDGILYTLFWGWGWERNEKNEPKHFWAIKQLYKIPLQDGDGI